MCVASCPEGRKKSESVLKEKDVVAKLSQETRSDYRDGERRSSISEGMRNLTCTPFKLGRERDRSEVSLWSTGVEQSRQEVEEDVTGRVMWHDVEKGEKGRDGKGGTGEGGGVR